MQPQQAPVVAAAAERWRLPEQALGPGLRLEPEPAAAGVAARLRQSVPAQAVVAAMQM